MRILVIEDDPGVAGHVVKSLKASGHVVDHAADGKDGLFLAVSERYDVLVVDRMLPHVDRLTIIQSLRASGDKTPALILSTLGDVDERVRGLRAGGDDYLTKPFAFSELLARRTEAEAERTRLTVADLEMDLLTRRVTRAGQVITRTLLLENLWDYNFDPQTNLIDVHVSRLRQKIDKPFARPLIHTVRGAGYVLRAPE